MEGQHALAKNRLVKRKMVKAVSPQLFSTELRYQEFSTRLRADDQKTWEIVASQDFGPYSKVGRHGEAGLLNIVADFGLNHHPHLHAALETSDVLKQKHFANAFYHCDMESLFLKHKGEQNTLNTWRKGLGHHSQSGAPLPLADGASTISRLSWKAAVDQVQVVLQVGDWLMCNMASGVRIVGSEEQRALLTTSADMANLLLDLFRGLPGAGGSTASSTHAGQTSCVAPTAAAGASEGCVVLRRGRTSAPSLQSLGQLSKICCMRVLHCKPTRVKRGPTESLAHPPRSDQLAVSLHKLVGFYVTTNAITIDYTPISTQSGVSSGSLDACAYLSLDVLVEHAKRRESMMLMQRVGSAEFQVHIDVPGFDAKVVHRVANRLIDASAAPALWDIQETEQGLALRSNVTQDRSDISVLESMLSLEFVDRTSSSGTVSSWRFTDKGLSSCRPVAKLMRRTDKSLLATQTPVQFLKDLSTYALLDLMHQRGWTMSILPRKKRRVEIQPYAIDSAKVFWIRDGAKHFCRESLVAHLSVEDGLLSGPLEALQKASYYLALTSPEKAKESGMSVVLGRGLGRGRGGRGRALGRRHRLPNISVAVPIADGQDSDGPPVDDSDAPHVDDSPHVEGMVSSDDSNALHVDDDDTSIGTIICDDNVSDVEGVEVAAEQHQPAPSTPVPPPAPQDLANEEDEVPLLKRLRQGGAPGEKRREAHTNDVVIFGTMFVHLRRAGELEPVGLSLPCRHHAGEDCARDVNFYTYTKGIRTRQVLTEEVAAKRLLAWQSDYVNEDGSLETRAQHCRRLPPFLATYSWADELAPTEAVAFLSFA